MNRTQLMRRNSSNVSLFLPSSDINNPIKRKEFDRQRKKQQMRELQNISGFTLKNYGIKNVRALKEAMPPYPDDDEVPATDATKNYATVSLCCLSVTNPFRNKLIELVLVNPWFDRIVLMIIVINCVFLALDKEVDIVTNNGDLIDMVFLILYTIEAVLKIIAQGFVMKEHSYLRDSWNILDFVVVILGWVGTIIQGNNISAIKVIRILRPLRTINQIPNMSGLVSTILQSLPLLFDVMVLFLFMLIMFGTIATQLLGGVLQNRCYTMFDGEKTIELGKSKMVIFCQTDSDCVNKKPEEVEESWCEFYGNPVMGTYSFDNILVSIMNIFQVISLSGWAEYMYTMREAMDTYVYDLFYVSCIILGFLVILNLMIAVQASYLDQSFDEEDRRVAQIQAKLEKKKKMMLEQEEQEGLQIQEEVVEEIVQDQQEPKRRSSKQLRGEKKNCLKALKPNKPECFIKLSNFIERLCENIWFQRSMTAMILLNTIVMAVEFYEWPYWLEFTCNIINLFLTVVFLIEMLMKMVGFGFKKYAADKFNFFDSFVVLMSIVELCLPGQGSNLSVLRAFRLLRIFKIIKSWKSLRKLLGTVLESLSAISNLGVLICLYLFISSLLLKQFYGHVTLIDEEGNLSRYSFKSTGRALITMFMILTGENWNDPMTQVMHAEDSLTPSILFIVIFIFGNFMLLNLFLAILLRSISEIDDNDEDQIKKTEETTVKQSAVKQVEISNLEQQAQEEEHLNSSNSNIEEEFEYIKSQLMRLSKNLVLSPEGEIIHQPASQLSQSKSIEPSDVSISINSHQKIESPRQNEDQQQQNPSNKRKDDEKKSKKGQQEEIPQLSGYSLFIFGPNNWFRNKLADLLHHAYFHEFVYSLIALNSLLLALDSPILIDPFQNNTIEIMLNFISWVFIGEFMIKIIVQGFIFGEKTYLKESWNILDFIIVLFTILTWILNLVVDSSNLSFVKGFRALRALRPLRVVSKNEGIKTVVNSMLLSIPALIKVFLIVLLFLLAFGILGIQLFKGKLGYCNDKSEEIQFKQDCVGQYNSTSFDDWGRINGTKLEDRVWSVPLNNYDDIIHSMLTFFEVALLSLWPDRMYEAIDAVDYDHVPKLDNNLIISLVFIIFIFLTTFFIMNLFISVIVDKFNDEIKKRQGSDNFTTEQKGWVKIQRLMLHTNPKVIPVEPINTFRLHCFRIVQSQAFEYLLMLSIVVNTLFLCIDYVGKSAELADILDKSNTFFVIFFTVEMTLKLTAYGFMYYWYVNWNKFDCILVIMSLISLNPALLTQLNFNPTALRIIRVSRLLRMVKTSEGIRALLKTLFMSIGNIINTAALLTLMIFTFSVAGMSLFGNTPDGEYLDENVNFRSFYIAMMTLLRAATGDSWNGIMHDCYRDQGITAIIYWTLYQLLTQLIFMNVFVAVIGESFQDNRSVEDENDIMSIQKKDIKAFQNTWARYNPMGEVYMRTVRLPDFLRELPPPLGYQGIRIDDTKLKKIIFCLNIRDHYGKVYYPEVMWSIFHSLAGMNDEKVLKCEQVINLMKVVKQKYKGLGKRVTLDSLCGNRYYRREITAIKYIQAIKILNKWRTFKDLKLQEKSQSVMNSPNQISEVNKTQTQVGNNQNIQDRSDLTQNTNQIQFKQFSMKRTLDLDKSVNIQNGQLSSTLLQGSTQIQKKEDKNILKTAENKVKSKPAVSNVNFGIVAERVMTTKEDPFQMDENQWKRASPQSDDDVSIDKNSSTRPPKPQFTLRAKQGRLKLKEQKIMSDESGEMTERQINERNPMSDRERRVERKQEDLKQQDQRRGRDNKLFSPNGGRERRFNKRVQ